jgi:membrane-bound lytic murein transglycosylase D
MLTDTVMVSRQVHLKQVSRSLGISMTVLRQLNPQYVRNIIPGRPGNPYTLILPDGQKERFASVRESIYQLPSDIHPGKSVARSGKAIVSGRQKIVHHVKAGESISHIALKYKVSVKSLRAWNHLSGNLVRKGQRIVVYVKETGDRG